MSEPKTWFTQAGDVNIAYQVLGDGPVDLLYAWGGFSNIEVMWEEPSCAAFFRRLSAFTRLILFDRRGCGVSDRGGNTVTPTLEERMQDALAVLDAVGSTNASVFGLSEGGVLAAWLAATHPERIRSITAYGTVARLRKDADHPWGWMDDETAAQFIDGFARGWGMRSDLAVQLWAPSMLGDERFKDWMAKDGVMMAISGGKAVPICGFYSFGEIAPLEAGSPTRFHHETMVAVLLGTE